MFFIASAVCAANGRPVIEFHPVIDCNAEPGSMPLTVDVPTDPYGKPLFACISREVILGGADVIRARHTKGRLGDSLTVWLSVDSQQRFYEYALNHPLGPIAVLVDGRTVEAPLLGPAAYPAYFEISGKLSAAEIDALVQRFQPPI